MAHELGTIEGEGGECVESGILLWEFERLMTLTIRGEVGDFVAAFIRSIIGVDRSVALKMFTQFIGDNELNSQQEEYLKTIINYVCENGDIKVDTIINDAPFSDYDVIDIWGENGLYVGKYIEKLHSVITA